MTGDIISYGVLASTFVVTGLRMWIEKSNGANDRSFAWLERFKRRAINRCDSIDS